MATTNEGTSLQSKLTRYATRLATSPLRYYREDTAAHTLVAYAGIKAVVALGALLVIWLRYGTSALLSLGFPFYDRDAVWYVGIAREWYAFAYPHSAVFPPFYPLLIKILSLNFPAAMVPIAWVLANACSFIGLYFLYKLVPLVIDERYRLRICFAYMIFPILTVVNLTPYSEPLFLALTIGAYYYWKQSRFGIAALLAALSIFTRYAGVFILTIFIVDLVRDYWSNRDNQRMLRQCAVIGVSLTSVGTLYLFYYLTFGDPFIVPKIEMASFRIQTSLTYLPLNLLDDLSSRYIVSNVFPYPNVTPLIVLYTLFVIVTALLFLKKELALSLYSLGVLVFSLSLYAPISFIRYAAAIFPLYLLFGVMLSDDWKKNMVIGAAALITAVQIMVLWIKGLWLF